MRNRTYRIYGEAFKRQVVAEIEEGKFTSPWAASQAYGIRGAQTVSRWARQYGRLELTAKRVTVTTVDDEDEKKALQKRVRELEKAVADSYMKSVLSESYFEIACKRMGIDPEEFKKKHATKLSRQQRPKGKQ